MSHVARVQMQIKSLKALQAACRALGLELIEGRTSFTYYGGKKAPCLHAIRVVGNSQAYEMGVIKSKEGDWMELSADFFAQGKGLVEKVGPQANLLKARYTAEASAESLKRQGFGSISIKQVGRKFEVLGVPA